MPKIAANGLELEYEEAGDRDAPAILLIMGLGGQLTLWPDEFFHGLADRGFRVIRFDNRDVGLSTKFEGETPPSMIRLTLARLFGFTPAVPYLLEDMALDAKELLLALGIRCAHIVGPSLGGGW